MPGNVESIAVSNVQSINAPLASKNLRVGRTCARADATVVGRRNPAISPAGKETSGGLDPAALSAPELEISALSAKGAAGLARDARSPDSRANAAPDNSRSCASCSADLRAL